MAALIDYENIVASATNLKLVTCQKKEIGTSPEDGSVIFEWNFDNPPTNTKLHSNPIEVTEGNFCILQDLDYVEPV